MFLLCFILYLRAISKYKSPGAYIRTGDLTGEFFALPVWEAYIWRGLFSEFCGISYFWIEVFLKDVLGLLGPVQTPNLLIWNGLAVLFA